MISREEAKQAIIDAGLKLIENPDTGQMWGSNRRYSWNA